MRVKRLHNFSVNHAMGTNSTVVKKFYEQYQAEINCLSITNPQYIWNCDESGCKDVPDELDVVGEIGVAAVNIVGKEHGEISTALTFANALGQCLHPWSYTKVVKFQTLG